MSETWIFNAVSHIFGSKVLLVKAASFTQAVLKLMASFQPVDPTEEHRSAIRGTLSGTPGLLASLLKAAFSEKQFYTLVCSRSSC